LQADDVRLTVGEPGKEVLQSLVDVVDVERRDLHGFAPPLRTTLKTRRRNAEGLSGNKGPIRHCERRSNQ
jgi:hypothetical protein